MFIQNHKIPKENVASPNEQKKNFWLCAPFEIAVKTQMIRPTMVEMANKQA
jgi:hypothetical protein